MDFSYYDFPPGKRVYRTLKELKGARIEPGDMVLLRDFAQVVPENAWSAQKARGRWQLVPYELSDGQKGKLLVVNDVAGDEGGSALPPGFEIAPDLCGWYAVWVGVPNLDLSPILSCNYTAVDVALDGEAYGGIGPEFGRRKKKLMGPTDVEIMCFWRCAEMDGRTLRFRSAFGTYLSQPWGLVRSIISSLCLVKLDEAQARAYREDLLNKENKRVIEYCDGFSHYWLFGEPGKAHDLWYPETYGYSDHGIYMFQTSDTGVVNYPSKITSLIGEGCAEEDWKGMRRGDKRVHEYVTWASESGHEGMRILPAACRKAGMEFHASLRMNLFWGSDGGKWKGLDKVVNGKWWFDHPEARKQGSSNIDYAHPEARKYIIGILSELASQYDVDGINLDFTRWPPVADPKRHDFNVLTSLIKEVREELDGIEKARGRKLPMSATVVDGDHARDEENRIMTLQDQKIDLEAWLATGALDFICVQTWRHAGYIELAHRYGVKYYCNFEIGPLELPGGRQDDPEWRDIDDPVAGEENLEQPPIHYVTDPLEIYGVALKQYRAGADGISFMNLSRRSMGRLGHKDELAEMVKTGTIWGQRIGESIVLHWQDECGKRHARE